MKKSSLPLQKSCDTGKKNICGKEDLVKLLRWHFGHAQFKGKQLEAIEAVLSGRDCFCLMPTGGGKSMCYQIPALSKTGIVLVVCPLIALMENQVMSLKEKGIAAEYLSSTQRADTRAKIHEDLQSGKPSLRLLYVTPELIATPGFMSKLKKIHTRGLLNLVAIDEAHCISTWGHDFRPSYQKLSSLRDRLPDVPILALTATAVPNVQKDVMESLCLRNPVVLRSSFNRPNIFYEVRYKDLLDDTYTDLSDFLKSSGNVCAIIYCLERTTCDDLSAHLSKNGISCAANSLYLAYHAGLNNKLRSSVLDNWMSSRIQVVVATVAFGYDASGIDKKDVRVVCHYNIPKSMEGFYQESGRAGRDQLPCRSILYYGMDDRKKMDFILRNAEGKKSQPLASQDGFSKKSLSDLNQMVEYCEGSGCCRKKILESFGEQLPASLCKKSCDACKHPNLVANYLEELKSTCAVGQKNRFSQILMRSPSIGTDESEFWNREDEVSGSEEDISDPDDAIEVVKSLKRSRVSTKSGLNDKIEFLQHAEESYYHNILPDKQVRKVEKCAISEAMREAGKQKLFNALKQSQQELGTSEVELQTAANFLENDCYNKYGKAGKSFYYSQLASTVRWLSTTSSADVMSRLATNGSMSSNTSENDASKSCSFSVSPSPFDQGTLEKDSEDIQATVDTETCSSNFPAQTSTFQGTMLPPIPSFSEYPSDKNIEKKIKLK